MEDFEFHEKRWTISCSVFHGGSAYWCSERMAINFSKKLVLTVYQTIKDLIEFRLKKYNCSMFWCISKYNVSLKTDVTQICTFILHLCRLYWNLIMLILLMANLIMLPVIISFFNDDTSGKWIAFNGVSDAVFILDIVVNFRTGQFQLIICWLRATRANSLWQLNCKCSKM